MELSRKIGLAWILFTSKRNAGRAPLADPKYRNLLVHCRVNEQKKGIFITTSDFTREAVQYVQTIDSKIVLINGETLANLMIDNDIGVTKVTSYDVKKVDLDFFTSD